MPRRSNPPTVPDPAAGSPPRGQKPRRRAGAPVLVSPAPVQPTGSQSAPGADATEANADSRSTRGAPKRARSNPPPTSSPKPAVTSRLVAAPTPAQVPAIEQPKPHASATVRPAGALPPARIPPEALAPRRNDRLIAWAAGLSVLAHALVLAIHFSPIDLKRTFDRGPPLEVALVNAKTKEKPSKADILAQANLDGGGNTDANRRAKTPLPVLPKDTPREDIALATERVQVLERQTQELLTQLKSAPSVPAQPKPTDSAEKTDSPTANELMQRTLEAMRLEAQIAKDLDAYQKRPKRRFVGARAEEYRFARYVEDWRLKVERVGNLNYPEAARQLKLYGSLLITVSIRADGSVEAVEVNRSSGHRVLDAAAVKIVEMAAPYGVFPSDIRRDTDILHITRTWTFTRADELKSE